jgi:hypothetical protein
MHDGAFRRRPHLVDSNNKNGRSPAALAALTVTALGVVFGDIGTSPLYALREVFHSAHLQVTRDNILGVLSLLFWTMTLVVSFKYVLLILRADNNGEGGLIAMMALATQAVKERPELRRRLLLLGLFGTAIFFGDAVITPAITVLGAVEGIDVYAPQYHGLIVPLTLVILTGLFAFQRMGTAVVGKFFGPVMLVWFAGADPARAAAHRRQPAGAGGAQPAARAGLRRPAPLDGLRGAGRGGAGGHRRRGALRRPRSLRQAADPLGLVRAGDAGAGHQLLRPGRAAAGRTHGHQEPLLPAGAGLGRDPAVRARHRGRHRGLAGAHQRLVQRRQAGHAAGHPAAHAHLAHLGEGDRADLRAGHQLGALRLRRRGRGVLRIVQPADQRLRRGGHHGHDHHHGADLLRHPPRLEAAAVAVRGAPPASSSPSTCCSWPPTC